jgi:hypothetical protein
MPPNVATHGRMLMIRGVEPDPITMENGLEVLAKGEATGRRDAMTEPVRDTESVSHEEHSDIIRVNIPEKWHGMIANSPAPMLTPSV